jgi:hypothetical protein
MPNKAKWQVGDLPLPENYEQSQLLSMLLTPSGNNADHGLWQVGNLPHGVIVANQSQFFLFLHGHTSAAAGLSEK